MLRRGIHFADLPSLLHNTLLLFAIKTRTACIELLAKISWRGGGGPEGARQQFALLRVLVRNVFYLFEVQSSRSSRLVRVPPTWAMRSLNWAVSMAIDRDSSDRW